MRLFKAFLGQCWSRHMSSFIIDVKNKIGHLLLKSKRFNITKRASLETSKGTHIFVASPTSWDTSFLPASDVAWPSGTFAGIPSRMRRCTRSRGSRPWWGSRPAGAGSRPRRPRPAAAVRPSGQAAFASPLPSFYGISIGPCQDSLTG